MEEFAESPDYAAEIDIFRPQKRVESYLNARVGVAVEEWSRRLRSRAGTGGPRDLGGTRPLAENVRGSDGKDRHMPVISICQ